MSLDRRYQPQRAAAAGLPHAGVGGVSWTTSHPAPYRATPDAARTGVPSANRSCVDDVRATLMRASSQGALGLSGPRPYARGMEWIVVLILVALVVVAIVSTRRNKERAIEQRRAELEPVKSWRSRTSPRSAWSSRIWTWSWPAPLDAGAHADYQRALDAYEAAKTAADRMDQPDDVRHVTQILEDGRYAITCVRARVAGEPLPTRRPPCFFDPRHGLSVTDVD